AARRRQYDKDGGRAPEAWCWAPSARAVMLLVLGLRIPAHGRLRRLAVPPKSMASRVAHRDRTDDAPRRRTAPRLGSHQARPPTRRLTPAAGNAAGRTALGGEAANRGKVGLTRAGSMNLTRHGQDAASCVPPALAALNCIGAHATVTVLFPRHSRVSDACEHRRYCQTVGRVRSPAGAETPGAIGSSVLGGETVISVVS